MSKVLLWPEQGDRLGRERTRQDPRTAAAALLAMLPAALRDACGLSCMQGWGTVWGASWVTGMDTLNCVSHAATRLSTSAASLSTSYLMACLPTADAHASAAVLFSVLPSRAIRLHSAVSTCFLLLSLPVCTAWLRLAICGMGLPLSVPCSHTSAGSAHTNLTSRCAGRQASTDNKPTLMLHILCDLHHVRCAPNDRNAADGCKIYWRLHIQVTNWHITQIFDPADVVHWERLQVKVPGAACHGTALQPQSSIVTVKFCLTAACYHSAAVRAPSLSPAGA